MPYIPPPPRPPAPPRPPPAPPRIPGPNIHMQQQQRFQQQQFQQQQQQRFHQQQRMQQQQQFQQQQRFHEQQRKFHQNIQMENQKRHQQQQQQLQRQQQALQFQRHQEELRRQQQENHRRQQQLAQDHLCRQQEHQRQQEFLRNFQRTAALNGATAVNIAPSEDPGIQQQECGVGGVQVETQQGLDLGGGGGGLTIELNMTGLNSNLMTSVPQSAPQPGPGGPGIVIQTTTPIPNGQQQATPLNGAPPPGPPVINPAPAPAPPAPVVVEKREAPNNTIALKDGTVIVIKSEDEILFRGPNGTEMVVNCLPLYEMPTSQQNAGQNSPKLNSTSEFVDSADTPSPGRRKSQGERKSFLIRARSAEALDMVGELELHDQDDRENRSEEESLAKTVPGAKKKWSRMSAAYSKNVKVMVHKNSSSLDDLTSAEPERASFQAEGAPSSSSAGGNGSKDAEEIAAGLQEGKLEKDGDKKEDNKSTEGDSKQENEATGSEDSPSPESAAVNQSPAQNGVSTEVEPSQSDAQATGAADSPQADTQTTSALQADTQTTSAPQADTQTTSAAQADTQTTSAPQADTQTTSAAQADTQTTSAAQADTQTTVEITPPQPDSQAIVNTDSPPVQSRAVIKVDSPSDPATEEQATKVASPKTSPAKPKKKALTRSAKSASPLDTDNIGSDEEGTKQLTVNYLDPATMSTLKRGSGSVSFYSRPEPVAVAPSPVALPQLEASIEVKEEETPRGSADSIKEEPSAENVAGAVIQKTKAFLAQSNATPNAPPPTGAVAGATVQPPAGGEAGGTVQETKAFLAQPNATPNAPPPYQEVDPVQETKAFLSSQPDAFPSAPAAPQPQVQPIVKIELIPTVLPVAPPTLEMDYVETSGWLNKLSHRKGVFGDKWQKRYFVLHRSWLYYFKKYGDSNPKGAIRLLPSGWCRPVAQGTPRMSDAVLKSNETTQAGIISVLRCMAVHKPGNFSASLCDLLASDGVAETFRSQTISVTNSQHSSRTYYMVAPSDQERERWVELITKNRRAYAHSAEALTTACKELKIMLRAVDSTIPPKNIPSLLCLLYSKIRTVTRPESLSDYT